MKIFNIDPRTARLVPVDKDAVLATLNDNLETGAVIKLPEQLNQYSEYDVFVKYMTESMQNPSMVELTADTDTESGSVSYSWKLDKNATANSGVIDFSVCFKSKDRTNEYNTGIFRDKIQEGLGDAPEEEEKQVLVNLFDGSVKIGKYKSVIDETTDLNNEYRTVFIDVDTANADYIVSNTGFYEYKSVDADGEAVMTGYVMVGAAGTRVQYCANLRSSFGRSAVKVALTFMNGVDLRSLKVAYTLHRVNSWEEAFPNL